MGTDMVNGTSETDGASRPPMARAEALGLLASQPVGRLVYTRAALPMVTPVNFTLHDGAILVRTAAGSALSRAVDGAVVAFEVDRLDMDASSGWSVIVTGRAELVGDDGEAVIRISTEMVTGRWAHGAAIDE
jgi:nitroimidazol reductase NimA-like FMN-containing flavoprotein (pyridoxamine 5'-phosphate oxidase superfamily)